MTDQPPRLSDHPPLNERRLRDMEVDAERRLSSKSPELWGDIQILINEVRRLRALAKRAIKFSVAPWCPLCAGQASHVDGCPWPELEAEAKRA